MSLAGKRMRLRPSEEIPKLFRFPRRHETDDKAFLHEPGVGWLKLSTEFKKGSRQSVASTNAPMFTEIVPILKILGSILGDHCHTAGFIRLIGRPDDSFYHSPFCSVQRSKVLVGVTRTDCEMRRSLRRPKTRRER